MVVLDGLIPGSYQHLSKLSLAEVLAPRVLAGLRGASETACYTQDKYEGLYSGLRAMRSGR